MFSVRVSCLAILQVVGQRCRIPFISTIRQTTDDTIILYGIEVELPRLFEDDAPRRLYFWSATFTDLAEPYEDAAFQAISCLQSLYDFVVLDYSYEAMVRQCCIVRQVFTVANMGAHLARAVVLCSQYETPSTAYVLAHADQLLQQLASILNPNPL